MSLHKKSSGFTLIELLVVIAIIGTLSAVVLGSLNSARQKARVTKVKAELFQISNAIKTLALDTGFIPTVGSTKLQETECVCNGACNGNGNELYVDLAAAGVDETDGNFPNWNGPYISRIPLDPWGSSYIFDSDYTCSTQAGCEAYSGQIVSVVHSAGPNKSAINAYDSDDIVRVFCAE
ncbi:MAG: prepilin-type N-terminal cleavage/methylation domain-containing protein [Patescibacteria group bacterium]